MKFDGTTRGKHRDALCMPRHKLLRSVAPRGIHAARREREKEGKKGEPAIDLVVQRQIKATNERRLRAPLHRGCSDDVLAVNDVLFQLCAF